MVCFQTQLSWLDIDPHERDREPLGSYWTSNTGEERGWHSLAPHFLPVNGGFEMTGIMLNHSNLQGSLFLIRESI